MGLALLRAAGDSAVSALTATGSVMGTPDFISPEQATDAHAVDIRSDLYSLGCTLYFLLAGAPPFPDGSLMEKLIKHKFTPPRPVEERRPDVPPRVTALLRRLLAKLPEERFQTPAELADALQPCVAEAAALPPPAGTMRERPAPSLGSASTLRPMSAGSDTMGPHQVVPPQGAAAGLVSAGEVAPPMSAVSGTPGLQDWSVSPADAAEIARPPAAPPTPGPELPERRRRWLTTGALALVAALAGLAAVLGWFHRPGADDGKLAQVNTQRDDPRPEQAPPVPNKDNEEPQNRNDGREAQAADGAAEGPVPKQVTPKDGRPPPKPRPAEPPPMPDQVLFTFRPPALRQASFSRSGDQLLAVSDDGVRLCNVAARREESGLPAYPYTAAAVRKRLPLSAVLSPTGRDVLFGIDDQALLRDNQIGRRGTFLTLWNRQPQAEPSVVGSLGESFVTSLALYAGADGRLLALAGDAQGRITCWDAGAEGKRLAVFRGDDFPVDCLAVSPNGRRALSGSRDGTAYLWDLQDSARPLLQTFAGHREAVTCAAFSTQGGLALAGGEDGSIRLLDLDAGKEARVLHGHGKAVLCVAFSADDRVALSGSRDGAVKLWDMAAGREVPRAADGPMRHEGAVLAVGFAPQGQRYGLSVGADGKLRHWLLPAPPP